MPEPGTQVLLRPHVGVQSVGCAMMHFLNHQEQVNQLGDVCAQTHTTDSTCDCDKDPGILIFIFFPLRVCQASLRRGVIGREGGQSLETY